MLFFFFLFRFSGGGDGRFVMLSVVYGGINKVRGDIYFFKNQCSIFIPLTDMVCMTSWDDLVALPHRDRPQQTRQWKSVPNFLLTSEESKKFIADAEIKKEKQEEKKKEKEKVVKEALAHKAKRD